MSEILKKIDRAIDTLIDIPGMLNEIKELRKNFCTMAARRSFRSSQLEELKISHGQLLNENAELNSKIASLIKRNNNNNKDKNSRNLNVNSIGLGTEIYRLPERINDKRAVSIVEQKAAETAGRLHDSSKSPSIAKTTNSTKRTNTRTVHKIKGVARRFINENLSDTTYKEFLGLKCIAKDVGF